MNEKAVSLAGDEAPSYPTVLIPQLYPFLMTTNPILPSDAWRPFSLHTFTIPSLHFSTFMVVNLSSLISSYDFQRMGINGKRDQTHSSPLQLY